MGSIRGDLLRSTGAWCVANVCTAHDFAVQNNSAKRIRIEPRSGDIVSPGARAGINEQSNQPRNARHTHDICRPFRALFGRGILNSALAPWLDYVAPLDFECCEGAARTSEQSRAAAT